MIILRLCLAIAGMYAVYIIAALLNQQIFNRTYQHRTTKHQHYFYHADLLQAVATLLASTCARLISRMISDPPNPIPLIQKCVLGVLYTNGVSCLNYALYYIPFSARMLFDSLDYLTTVFVSIFLSRYPRRAKDRLSSSKLTTALIISTGVLLFTYCFVRDKISVQQFSKKDQVIGYLFVTLALIGKGFFIDSQSFNKGRYRPTQQQILYTVNFGSFVVSLMLLVAKQQLHKAVIFCIDHPAIIQNILYFALLSAIGQQFIYYISYNFSVQQNMIPLLSTTRKVLSLVVSLLIFGGSFTLFMVIGLVLAFGGMVYELIDETYYFITKTQPQKIRLLEQNKIE